ncbi:MAG: hypothetical protein P8J81_06855, partial [Luminiphilus sp.]|nr:hypothetical protein [Luminiphilus sp.]
MGTNIFYRHYFVKWLAVFAVVTSPFECTHAENATYLGNAGCAECHQTATSDWTGSHHDLAMQVATPETVLGNFNNATFEYSGTITTFSRRDDAFFVT